MYDLKYIYYVFNILILAAKVKRKWKFKLYTIVISSSAVKNSISVFNLVGQGIDDFRAGQNSQQKG